MRYFGNYSSTGEYYPSPLNTAFLDHRMPLYWPFSLGSLFPQMPKALK